MKWYVVKTHNEYYLANSTDGEPTITKEESKAWHFANQDDGWLQVQHYGLKNAKVVPIKQFQLATA